MRIRLVIGIDDVRHYNELVLAAKIQSVPTYAIEHGHFTKYHTGWLRMTNLKGEIIRPDGLVVWSEYWKKTLLFLGTYFKPEEIIVGGSPSYEKNFKKAIEKEICVLMPYETDAPKKEMNEYIQKIIQSGAKVIFKVRTDMPDNIQLEEYGLTESNVKLVVEREARAAFEKADVVLGSYSTFLYDGVARGLPVGLVESSIDYGLGMIEGGLADLVSKNEEMKTALLRLANTSEETLIMRRKKLLGEETKELKLTLQDIIKRYV